ncbi:MAG: ATP-binding protein [Calditrichia bacterium]
MNVLFLGQNFDTFQSLKEVLADNNYGYLFRNINEIGEELPDIPDNAIAIIDITGLNSLKLNFVYHFLSVYKQFDIPVLAIIPQSSQELRTRFLELGVHDYLVPPYDAIDLQTKIKNLSRFSRAAIQTYLTQESPILTEFLKEFSVLLAGKTESFYSKDPDLIIKKTIEILNHSLNAENILYFSIENNDRIRLKYSSPDFPADDPLEIALDGIAEILRSMPMRKKIGSPSIDSGNTFFTHLKSYLNLETESIAFWPIEPASQLEDFLLILPGESDDFGGTESAILDFTARFIENIIREEKFRTLLENKLKEKTLAYSFEFLEHVLNQLNFGVIVVDSNRIIQYLNKPSAKLLQLNADEAMYQPLENILGADNTGIILSTNEQINGTFERPEIEIKTAEGEKILIGFNIMEFQESSSDDEGFIISFKDITYSKELQEEMRRMDRLASLGVMASGIAHEIRNPLAGIKAIAQTFEDEFAKDDPKNEFVKRIIKQVNRLDDMLKVLFSYAKPQRANRQFHHVELIIQEVMALLKQKLQQQNIKLSQSYASNLPPLFIDNSQIQQVLFNLILNSVEAIEGEGQIEISIEPIRDELKIFQRKPFYKKITENPYVLIHIADSGCGISSENLQQIFNPFFTTKSYGTGLGLSIVYQIVQENNGIIYFESETSKGTDCYLFLPAFEPVMPLTEVNNL